MADKQATKAAEEKAEQKGVEVSSLEGSGKGGKVTAQDVEKADEKFLVWVNPEVGSYRHVFEDGRVLYRNPSDNPEGYDAQFLSEREFEQYASEEHNGLKVLLRQGGGE